MTNGVNVSEVARLAVSRARAVVAALAVASVVTSAGCGSTVTGSPTSTGAAVTATISTALADLSLRPGDFPSPYVGIELPVPAASAATEDLDGIAVGADVDPPSCVPPVRSSDPADLEVVVGSDNEARTTISVELQRVRTALSEQKEQWGSCPSVTAISNGATATVTTSVVPPPPVNADDTAAIRRTVSSGGGAVMQSALALVAQIADVRITATFMTYSGTDPDTAALDQLFTEAVQKVGAAR